MTEKRTKVKPKVVDNSTYSITIDNGSGHERMGWECPRCGKVWAPGVKECACVPNKETTVTTGDDKIVWEHKPYPGWNTKVRKEGVGI